MNLLVLLLLGLLAIAGNARIGLFSLNRLVFAEKHESDRLRIGLIAIPVALAALLPLYWFFHAGVRTGRMGPLAIAGAVWLALTVATGVYWLIDRSWYNFHPPTVGGVIANPSERVHIREGHVQSKALRALGIHNDVYDLEITSHDVVIPDLPASFEGYEIAFMTDTHVTGFMREDFYRRCVEEVAARDVDLVLLGGDFVSWKADIELMARVLLTDLRAKDGVWAVLGNHDYWTDPDAVVAAMTARGVRFLVNRSTRITRGPDVIDLIGIDELYRGTPDIEATFRGVPGNRPCIGVSHHPDIAGHIEDQRVDLLLAGHTHGGQIRLPFLGAIVVPSKHEALYASGFHRENQVLLYVSRGLGAVPPVRILCPPELATFRLVRERRTGSDEDPTDLPLRPERRA